jgi:flavin reductase (DIM6/NTAB) family NADH-FMN oxidoreductase RutF
MEFRTDIFSQFDQTWGLVTAGSADAFNTMTISWGGLGTLWGKSVATFYIRTSRYTHEFVENSDYFTVSFYPESFKKTLGILGSRSGRNMDKMHDSGLTPRVLDHGMTFAEAEVTLVCRKLFKAALPIENIPEDIVKSHYQDGDWHDMYIGEVVEILK